MPKPQWLIDLEKKKNRREPDKCGECIYLGKPSKHCKYKGKKTVVYECSLHSGCFNTEFAICCGDFRHR